MVRLSGISKSFDGHPALAGVTLDVTPGETTVLIGPSGCGKSTLLRTVLGLVKADAGFVEVFGKRLSADTLQDVRRRTGYVIQDGGLFPHLTARENVTLLAQHVGWVDARISERIQDLATLVRLPAHRLDLYPSELSGGQQQRVGLMRALFLDPDLLLMDEPLGALDPMIRAGLQDELLSIFRELRKTVLLVTHDLAEAAHLGDRIVLLRQGEIVQDGAITDLLSRPNSAFVTAFVNAQRRLDPRSGGVHT